MVNSIGVMICFGQGGLRSISASSSYVLFSVIYMADGLNLNKEKVGDGKPL